jgi:hypothetical protein
MTYEEALDSAVRYLTGFLVKNPRAVLTRFEDAVRADQREQDASLADQVDHEKAPGIGKVIARMIRTGTELLQDVDVDAVLAAGIPDAPHVQVGGDHYRSTITPFQVIDAWGLDFYRASALKYVMRAGNKPGASAGEDLRKAAHYLTEAAVRADAQDGERRG